MILTEEKEMFEILDLYFHKAGLLMGSPFQVSPYHRDTSMLLQLILYHSPTPASPYHVNFDTGLSES